VPGSDPIAALQAFIDEKWALAQPVFFPRIPEGPRVHPEVTPSEARYFLASVTGPEPLCTVDDQNRVLSDRYPPRSDGTPRVYRFFEQPGRLRLETVIDMAAGARLRDEFGWPREHMIFESPRVLDESGQPLLSGEALDLLLLEEPCAQLKAEMTVPTTQFRIGGEAKADKKLLDKLLQAMQVCHGAGHREHNKCRAIKVFRPRMFLAFAAAETWRLFDVVQAEDGYAVLGSETSDFRRLHFERRGLSTDRRPPTA
jgi:hypothetical protein